MKGLTFILFFLFLNVNAQVRDTTFGLNGNVRTSIGTSNEMASHVLIQSDGKILVAGGQADHPIFGPQRFATVRYLSNGNLDTSFGTNGKATFLFESQSFLNDISLQSDGKILLAGQSSSGYCVARVFTDGTLDTSFGTNGFTVLAPAFGSAGINSVVVYQDDSFLVTGAEQIQNSTNFSLKLIKFTSNGFIDTSFGNQGILMPDLDFESNSGGKIQIQVDGKIVIGGTSKVNENNTLIDKSYFLRLNADGSLDTNFGTDGIILISNNYKLTDFILESNNDIILIGNVNTNAQGTSGNIFISKYDNLGLLDSSFGTNGRTIVSVNTFAEYANTITKQSDGKFLLGGSYFNTSTVTDGLIVRFLQNGQIDNTFGTNGVFQVGVSNGTDIITDMIMTPNNQIVTTGYANYSTNFDFSTLRINIDITLDSNIEEKIFCNVYPNPVVDVFHIVSQELIDGVELYDLNGRLLLKKDHNDFECVFSIADFPKGVYLIKITSKKGLHTEKIVKE